MTHRLWLIWGLILCTAGLIGLMMFMKLRPAGQRPVPVPSALVATSASSAAPTASTLPGLRRITAAAIPDVDAAFQFTATMPAGWQAAAVPEIQAINLFDPTAAGTTDLDKSQIFLRFFQANSFVTLSTVTIHERTELTINSRPAVRYDIEKKAGVADFPSQPFWRNQRHTVTDIRVAETNPSLFYVIARRPDLDPAVYAAFLDSLAMTTTAPVGLLEPTVEFRERITKKPFGILITPETSPVQPERFRGYHTAVDVEFGDVTNEVPVFAVAAGTVVQSGTASGYGGVLVIRHELPVGVRTVIYGHLDPASLPGVGTQVQTGQPIGILGDGGTPETDGERKHLHFGIRADDAINIRGYVVTEDELAAWQDPLELFTK